MVVEHARHPYPTGVLDEVQRGCNFSSLLQTMDGVLEMRLIDEHECYHKQPVVSSPQIVVRNQSFRSIFAWMADSRLRFRTSVAIILI